MTSANRVSKLRTPETKRQAETFEVYRGRYASVGSATTARPRRPMDISTGSPLWSRLATNRVSLSSVACLRARPTTGGP
jgi:hypothetical protein